MNTSNLSLQIYQEMCPQQTQDLQEMLSAIDEFGATTRGLSGSSSQAYVTFIEARDNIRKQFEDKFKNYRLVVVVK